MRRRRSTFDCRPIGAVRQSVASKNSRLRHVTPFMPSDGLRAGLACSARAADGIAAKLCRSSIRGHRSEIMFAVLVVVLRRDHVAG